MIPSVAYSEHIEWLVIGAALVIAGLASLLWLILTDWWDSSHGPGIDRELRRRDDRFARRNPIAKSETPRISPGGSTTNKEHTP